MIEDTAERIVGLQTKYPKMFIFAFMVATLALMPGILGLLDNVEPSLEKVLPQDIAEVRTMNDMRSEFGADMMYLIVYAESPVNDVREPEMLMYIHILSERLRGRENILEVTNLADLVKQGNGNVIPESLLETRQILKRNIMSSQYVNDDYSFSVIRIRSDTGASAKTITEVVNAIEEDIASVEEFNPGARIQMTGFNAIDKATFEVIMSDFAFITMVSLMLVAIVVFTTFRSIKKGIMPLLVVMVALIWTMSIAGYLGFTITVVSMVAAAMIMGLGIDFGIHVVHSYYHERKTKKKEPALKATMGELLRAMTAASFTTMAGFLALLFGVLPAMKTLGMILAMGILNTLFAAVFLLPVLVYLQDKEATK